MPLTTLDTVPALVVIDLQKGLLSFPTAQPIGDIIRRTAQIARAFRERGLPVVLVNVTGQAPGRTDAGRRDFSPPADWTEFVPELGKTPEDIVVSKQRWGAFLDTPLQDRLQEKGVTQVFFTGVATSIGVESSARSAYDYGYNVVLVTDAMTDLSDEAHSYAVEKVFPRMGETTTTDAVLKALAEK